MTDLLPEEFVERVALRVVELLADDTASTAHEWVDARRVADELGVSRDWVYSHATGLGAVPLGECGSGRRPRLRFNLATAIANATANRGTTVKRPSPTQPPRERSRRAPDAVQLLPIRGRSEAA